MLDMIFGFNARLGRLMYFLLTIALGAVNVALAVPLAYYFYQQGADGHMPESIWSAGWPVYTIIGFGLLGTFMLSSMRIRDIGWDPIIAIPAWIAVVVTDHLVSAHLPALAIGPSHAGISQGTVVGSLVNLGVTVLLLFCPGGEFTAAPPTPGVDAPRSPDRPMTNSTSGAGERYARASGQFGRRA
jgi:uncharacterized membrane protein YhaH (DUF805 family)